MEERKHIIIEGDNYILREAHIDSEGDTVWDVKDKKTGGSFTVHSTAKGRLYITYFKHCHINSSCSYAAIRKICEILLERDLKPTINIYYKNTHLIRLCCAVGFRKVKTIKHLYRLNNLK